MMELKVYINGKIVNADSKDAVVSVFDRGLNYGDGVFETLKAENCLVQFKKEHISRLTRNAAAIGIQQSGFQRLLNDIKNGAIERLLRESNLAKVTAYVRITITRGIDLSGHLPSLDLKPTTIIVVKPLEEKVLYKIRSTGATAVLLNTLPGAMPQVKSLNFLQNVMGKAEATRKGAYEGLFTNKGLVTEGTASNIFIVKNNIIKTPPADELILPGIMRRAVILLAKKQKLEVMEKAVSPNDVLKADEAFLTNSIIGIVPLVKLSNKRIRTGKPGPITRYLQSIIQNK